MKNFVTTDSHLLNAIYNYKDMHTLYKLYKLKYRTSSPFRNASQSQNFYEGKTIFTGKEAIRVIHSPLVSYYSFTENKTILQKTMYKKKNNRSTKQVLCII